MERLVKTETGYKVVGHETYKDTLGVTHTITWMRFISEKEANEFARRKLNEIVDAKPNRNKAVRVPIRKKRFIR